MTVNLLVLQAIEQGALQRFIKPPSVEAFARALASPLDFYLPERETNASWDVTEIAKLGRAINAAPTWGLTARPLSMPSRFPILAKICTAS